MNADWLPGLPDNPCVCDVRTPAHTYTNVRVECFDGSMEACVSRCGMSELWLKADACQWRPIPVPDGA